MDGGYKILLVGTLLIVVERYSTTLLQRLQGPIILKREVGNF